MANKWVTVETVADFILGGSKITADGDCNHEIKRCLLLSYDQLSILRTSDCFANKGPSSQGYGFSGSHVWLWELNYKESWALKNWCFWTVVLEKTLESPLDCKETHQSILKEISPECPLKGLSWSWNSNSWPPDNEELTHLKDWRQEEKGTVEEGMVGWHHQLNGHEFG